jgi:hypothetical protein
MFGCSGMSHCAFQIVLWFEESGPRIREPAIARAKPREFSPPAPPAGHDLGQASQEGATFRGTFAAFVTASAVSLRDGGCRTADLSKIRRQFIAPEMASLHEQSRESGTVTAA